MLVLVALATLVGCSDRSERAVDGAINSSATMASTNETLRINQPQVFQNRDAVVTSGTNLQFAEAAGASTSSSDGALANRLKTALQSDTALTPLMDRVQISAERGKIVLSGVVQTEAQKQNIHDRAKEIVGAENVENNLEVKATPDSIPDKKSPTPQNR